MPTEFKNPKVEMHPYTKSTAMTSGWRWTIPTYTRIGNGYVYSSKHITPEQAEQELRESIGEFNAPAKHLKMKCGVHKEIAVKNVCAVGLSAGFIEPLESTGLALMMTQISMLTNSVKDNTFNILDSQKYNFEFSSIFQNCVDFVSMHYSKTNRTEPFWQHVRENYKESEGVNTQIANFADGIRYTTDKKPYHIFSGANWSTWLAQLGYPTKSNFNITKEEAETMLLKHHNVIEKYRYNWSQHHATEIDRMKELQNFKGDI
jgi:tryptophan halogenase